MNFGKQLVVSITNINMCAYIYIHISATFSYFTDFVMDLKNFQQTRLVHSQYYTFRGHFPNRPIRLIYTFSPNSSYSDLPGTGGNDRFPSLRSQLTPSHLESPHSLSPLLASDCKGLRVVQKYGGTQGCWDLYRSLTLTYLP
jgi:hypothetical protein